MPCEGFDGVQVGNYVLGCGSDLNYPDCTRPSLYNESLGLHLIFPDVSAVLDNNSVDEITVQWNGAVMPPALIGDMSEWECFRTIPGSRIPSDLIDWDFIAQVDRDLALQTRDNARFLAERGSNPYYEGAYKARRSRVESLDVRGWHMLSAAIKYWSQTNTSSLAPFSTIPQGGSNQDIACGIIIYPRKRIAGAGTGSGMEEPGDIEREGALIEASIESMLAKRESDLGLTTATGYIGSDEMGELGAHLLGQVTSHTVAGQVYDRLGGYAGSFNDAVGAVGIPTWTYSVGFGPNQIEIDTAKWVPGHPEFPWNAWYAPIKALLTVVISGWGFWRLWLMFAPATVIPGWQRGNDGN